MLLTQKQSGFGPNGFYVNQFLSIVHSVYSDFGYNQSLEARGNFLDISKPFDKVWHEGTLHNYDLI